MEFVIGISGASGSCYGRRIVQVLAGSSHRCHLIVSEAGGAVLEHELKEDFHSWPERFGGDTVRIWSDGNLFAPFCSGSNPPDGMAVIPCSMGTLARIAAGTADTLMTRAADVCLKERRPLVLTVREAPLNLVHIENMKRVTMAGATVLPASPGFYHHPATLDDLVDHVVGKTLQALGAGQDLFPRWGEDGAPAE